MSRRLALSLLVSLLITLLAEGTAAYLCGVRGRKSLLLVLLSNTLTNPPVVLLCFFFKSLPLQIALEALVFAVEGALYRAGDMKQPFRLSLLCNGCSYLAGIVIKLLF